MRGPFSYTAMMVAALACSEPIIEVDLRTADCGAFTGYYIELNRPDIDTQDCVVDLCTPGVQSANADQCLDGVQTESIPEGEPFQLVVGLYSLNRQLVACGVESDFDGAGEGDTVVLRLQCGDTVGACPDMLSPDMLTTGACAP